MRGSGAGNHAEREAARPDQDGAPPREAHLPFARDEEVAAGVHEVQNALTGVLGWLEVARSSRDAAVRDKALDVIHRGVQRVSALVATLADPAERFAVRPRAFRVAPLVAEVYELLHPKCAAMGVSLATEPVDPSLGARGDPGRVVQVLTNLVLNAADAVAAAGPREARRGQIDLLVAEAEGDRVSIAVRDDGTGMDDATAARAFEPKFTTHATPSGVRRAGSGLGLAICRALVEAMDGALAVVSAPGEGTTVTLVLPRAEVTPSVAPAPADEPRLLAGTHVLVVDDEPAIRELLEVALALRGAEVTTAENAVAARAALASRAYDVALVDETLGPNESGAALLLDVARAASGTARVLMTGAASVDHVPVEASRWLLRKPFSLDEAVALIASALAAR